MRRVKLTDRTPAETAKINEVAIADFEQRKRLARIVAWTRQNASERMGALPLVLAALLLAVAPIPALATLLAQ